MSCEKAGVDCGVHGTSPAAFLCGHLLDGEQKGFHLGQDPQAPDALCPSAWCSACKVVVDREGGWTDAAFGLADAQLVCAWCYEDIRARHWIQDDEAWRDLITVSSSYLQEQQQSFMEDFRVAAHSRWHLGPGPGLLTLGDEGQAQVEARVSFAGSFSERSNTWMWAWANSSYEESEKSAARSMRELGVRAGFMKLACAHWPGTLDDGGQMTAIMARELGAIGVYRTLDSSPIVFMTIASAKWLEA